MQELIDLIVTTVQVDSKQAAGGAAVLLRAAREKLGPGEFEQSLGQVEGLHNLMRQAPEAGAFGKLFGGFATAVGGGNTAILAGVVTGFGKLGLNQEHALQFVPVMLDYLRAKVDPAIIDRLEKTLQA
jgi:hypothetical protein